MSTQRDGDPWAGFPEDLRDMMMAIYELDDRWFPLDDALERLLEELERANPEDEADVLERVFWVDRLFRDSLCNGELYDEEWRWCRPTIGRVLGEAERLMAGVRRWGYGDLDGLGPKEISRHPLFLAQRLNSYLCVQAGYEEDRDEFDRRASRALEDALLGVSFVMYSQDVKSLAEMEDTEDYGFYLFGQRFWTEPLALVRASADEFMAKGLLGAYGRYIDLLGPLVPEDSPDAVAFAIRLFEDATKAAERLSQLAD